MYVQSCIFAYEIGASVKTPCECEVANKRKIGTTRNLDEKIERVKRPTIVMVEPSGRVSAAEVWE
jgi:hypothetical protein